MCLGAWSHDPEWDDDSEEAQDVKTQDQAL